MNRLFCLAIRLLRGLVAVGDIIATLLAYKLTGDPSTPIGTRESTIGLTTISQIRSMASGSATSIVPDG
jgi:hypothetical protein